jgi:hypothetical protein
VTDWEPSDLDRCEHGQHCEDPCGECPGGMSVGNVYLDPLASTRLLSTRGVVERQIGTTKDRKPIWVTPAHRTLPLD